MYIYNMKTVTLFTLLCCLYINNSVAQCDTIKSKNQTFENWKGSLEQVDDVCIVGVKI